MVRQLTDLFTTLQGNPAELALTATSIMLVLSLLFAIIALFNHHDGAAGVAVLMGVAAVIILWTVIFVVLGNPFLTPPPTT